MTRRSPTAGPGRPSHGDVLTPAEWRVAEGIRHGLTNTAIAERLGISANAVKFHVSNLLSKLGLSSRAEVRKWRGIRNDSPMSELAGSGSAETPLGQIGQISRQVLDIELMTDWYAGVLGLRLLYQFEGLAFFDCAGVRLMLAKGEGGSGAIIYFVVADIGIEHSKLEDRGAEVVAAPHLIHRHEDGTEEWMSFYRDPEGGTIALMCSASAIEEEDR